MHCTSPARRFLRDERAQSASEYGMLLALVAIVVIVVVAIFGQALQAWLQQHVTNFFAKAP